MLHSIHYGAGDPLKDFTRLGRVFELNEVWDGTMTEIIIYPSDQSANRTGIEGNINSAYSIY